MRPLHLRVYVVSDEAWQEHGIHAPYSAVAMPIDDGAGSVFTREEVLVYTKMARLGLSRQIRMLQAELAAEESPADGQET